MRHAHLLSACQQKPSTSIKVGSCCGATDSLSTTLAGCATHVCCTALLRGVLPPLLKCAGLSALVQSEREARLAAAQSQVSFDAEVAARKLGKLQAYFNSTLCQHTVTVHPLAAADPNGAGGGRRSRSVSTLAPPELPQEVQVRGTQLLAPCLEGGQTTETRTQLP